MSACELATILVGAFSLSARAAMPPPVEIPINITPGASVTVPFSISSSGTHDLELQYHTDADTYHKILRNRLLENISGTVTLSSEGKCLERVLPTGWGRPWGSGAGRAGTVIVRFRAEAHKRYLCMLHITHVPPGLPHEALLIVKYITPHFHPGHRVYELQ